MEEEIGADKMYPENLPAKYIEGLKPEEIPTIEARTRRKVQRFLKAFKADPKLSTTSACASAKISTNTLAKWRLYPEFQYLFDEINEIRRMRIEDYSIEQCLTDKRATLERMFNMKKLDPTYRDRQEIRSGNVIINISPEAIRESLRREASIEERIRRGDPIPGVIDSQRSPVIDSQVVPDGQ